MIKLGNSKAGVRKMARAETRFAIEWDRWNGAKANISKHNALFNEAVQVAFDKDRGHEDPVYTRVKFGLLDKSYSAGLRRWFRRCNEAERAGRHKGNDCNCSPVTRYVDKLYATRDGEAFKKLMHDAARVRSLSTETLPTVIMIAEKFQKMLKPLLRDEATVQSFFSKYLWFHAGITPVFDVYAKAGLRTASQVADAKRPRLTWDYISVYNAYARESLNFMEEYHGSKGLNKKQIKEADDYLVWIGGGS